MKSMIEEQEELNDEIEEIDSFINELKKIIQLDPNNKEKIDSGANSAISHLNQGMKVSKEHFDTLNSEVIKFENDDKNKEHLKKFIPVAHHEKYKQMLSLSQDIINFLLSANTVRREVSRIYRKSYNLNKALDTEAGVLKKLEELNNKFFELMEEKIKNHSQLYDKLIDRNNERMLDIVNSLNSTLINVGEALKELKPKQIEHKPIIFKDKVKSPDETSKLESVTDKQLENIKPKKSNEEILKGLDGNL